MNWTYLISFCIYKDGRSTGKLHLDIFWHGLPNQLAWQWTCLCLCRFWTTCLVHVGFSLLSLMIWQQIWQLLIMIWWVWKLTTQTMRNFALNWWIDSVKLYKFIKIQNSKDSKKNAINLFLNTCWINTVDVKKYFSNFRCVEEFNRIYKYSLFIWNVWAILFLATTLITTQFLLVEYIYDSIQCALCFWFEDLNINFSLFIKWEDHWNGFEMSTTILADFWAFTLNFLACEVGQRVTSQYEIFGDELRKCNWHVLPIEMQRIYLTFLLDTQQPIFIQSYGGIVCSRETYKKVGFEKNILMKSTLSTGISLCLLSRR